jgi:hypothetical protein
MTFIELQIKNIDGLVEGISQLLDESDIKYSAIPGFLDVSGNYTVSIHKTADVFQLQSKLFKDFTHLVEILEVIIDHESKEVKKIFSDNTIYTKKIVEERSFSTWDESLDEVKSQVRENWDQIKNLLQSVYTEEAEEVIIPDTSYLLDNNDFTKWSSRSGKSLTIVIPTIVLQELDEKKEFHRNPEIQKVAQSIAKRIMSILTRNPNSDVKTIIKSKVYLKLESVEPKQSNTLESLDFSVPDDRFIASAFEIIRRYTNSDCYIASKDINQNNKAIYYGIPIK